MHNWKTSRLCAQYAKYWCTTAYTLQLSMFLCASSTMLKQQLIFGHMMSCIYFWTEVNIEHAYSRKRGNGTLCSHVQTNMPMLYSIDELQVTSTVDDLVVGLLWTALWNWHIQWRSHWVREKHWELNVLPNGAHFGLDDSRQTLKRCLRCMHYSSIGGHAVQKCCHMCYTDTITCDGRWTSM